MNGRRQRTSVTILALIIGACIIAPGKLEAGGETMTLRINDTTAEAGDRVAVVLRTYAPRGVGRGQICLRANPNARGGGGPLLALEEVVVFSELGDAEVVQTFDGPSQVALIEFSSLSATINWTDGAMAVFFFRLDGALQPGQNFDLELDLAETFLIDAEEQSIQLRLRGGELTVRDPSAPHELAAEGDDVVAGEIANLGVETAGIFAIGSGQVALRWDPATAAGSPVVSMDPRHGVAFFSVDLAEPGLALVTFDSPDGSLNEIPGTIVSVDLPTAGGAPPASPVTLDPLLTHLEDPAGSPIPIMLIADVLEIEFSGTIFTDGFESGDVGEWTTAVQ